MTLTQPPTLPPSAMGFGFEVDSLIGLSAACSSSPANMRAALQPSPAQSRAEPTERRLTEGIE